MPRQAVLGESALSPDAMRRLADRLRAKALATINQRLAVALRRRAAEWEDRAALTENYDRELAGKSTDAPRQ